MKELIELLNKGWKVVKGESFNCGVNIVELTKKDERRYVIESRVTGVSVTTNKEVEKC